METSSGPGRALTVGLATLLGSCTDNELSWRYGWPGVDCGTESESLSQIRGPEARTAARHGSPALLPVTRMLDSDAAAKPDAASKPEISKFRRGRRARLPPGLANLP